MKLLFLTPYLPGPPIFGGQRRIHGLMTHLARSHEVSVVALVDAALDHREGVADTRTYCRNVVTVVDGWHRVSGRSKRLLQFGSLMSPNSWEHSLYRRRSFQRALDEHLATHSYDVIVCEFAFMAVYRIAEKHPVKPCLVLDEHNVEYDILRRTVESAGFGRKVFNAINWRKLRREEMAAWSRFDGCTVTSVRDEEIIRFESPYARTAVVPNGVDTEGFAPRGGAQAEPLTMLFFGAINYYPNADGALYFAAKILPLLRVRYPNVRFRIVGPVEPGPVMELKKQGIEVLGFVDDVKAEIARAAVVVVPLRIGGGTRLKILEAMSMGRPVVSTKIGAEGLELEHDGDILLADSAEDFAHQVGRVFDEPGLSARLGAAARKKAADQYSWKASGEKMQVFFEDLLKRTRQDPDDRPSSPTKLRVT
jgi:glycosyltransferase involved in cell wall biosynthesis